jgi:hypothetical protein
VRSWLYLNLYQYQSFIYSHCLRLLRQLCYNAHPALSNMERQPHSPNPNNHEGGSEDLHINRRVNEILAQRSLHRGLAWIGVGLGSIGISRLIGDGSLYDIGLTIAALGVYETTPWTLKPNWTGAEPFWMVVSCRPKRGRGYRLWLEGQRQHHTPDD